MSNLAPLPLTVTAPQAIAREGTAIRTLRNLADELEALNCEYIFVREANAIMRLENKQLMGERQFKLQLANRYATVGGSNAQVPVAPQWLKWPGRAECERLVYEPSLAPGLQPDHTYNLYMGSGLVPREGDVSAWHRLMNHMFPNDPEARRWFEQWVAYPLQHPGTKLATAVLFWGTTQGAGKSLLGELVGALYGKANSHELNQQDFASDFNEWAVGKQFVLVNEIVSSGRRHEADRLKNLVTQQQMVVNRKYQPTYVVRDCINYFFTSNHPDAILLADEDRRFFVVRVERKLSPALIRDVVALKNDPGLLLHHLLHRDLTGFDPKAPAPMTAAKEAMIALGHSELEEFVAEKITAAEQGETTTMEALKEEFDPDARKKVSLQAIAAALDKFGAKRGKQKRVPGTNQRIRPWILRPKERKSPTTTPNEGWPTAWDGLTRTA